jgi:hypothetical protein
LEKLVAGARNQHYLQLWVGPGGWISFRSTFGGQQEQEIERRVRIELVLGSDAIAVPLNDALDVRQGDPVPGNSSAECSR